MPSYGTLRWEEVTNAKRQVCYFAKIVAFGFIKRSGRAAIVAPMLYNALLVVEIKDNFGWFSYCLRADPFQAGRKARRRESEPLFPIRYGNQEAKERRERTVNHRQLHAAGMGVSPCPVSGPNSEKYFLTTMLRGAHKRRSKEAQKCAPLNY